MVKGFRVCSCPIWSVSGISVPPLSSGEREWANEFRSIGLNKTVADIRSSQHSLRIADPDGYSIELLQQDFEENYESQKWQSQFAMGTPVTLGQVTLQITDPEKSLAFYETALGLR